MKKIVVFLLLFLPLIFVSAQSVYYGSAYNSDGEEIISKSRGYTLVSFHKVKGRNGFYEVCNGKKYGICDVSGKEIIPCKYEGVGFSDGHFYAHRGSNEKKMVYTGTVDFDITLDCEGKVVIRQPLKNVNKELYNVLAKQYKIKKAYVDNLGGSGTYICVVDKYDYKYLFDMSGKLLVENFYTIYPIRPCEEYFKYPWREWIEATSGGLVVIDNQSGYLIKKDGEIIKLPGKPELSEDFLQINTGLYTQNGRGITPPNASTYYSNICGDFVKYFMNVDGVYLYGAHNYRTNSDSIPIVYSELSFENKVYSENGVEQDIMVRQHFYQDFVKYTPGVTTTEVSQYSEAEKLLMNRKYDESLAAVQSKKDRGEEMDLVDGLIIFHDILEKYYPYGNRVSQLVKRVNNNNWNYYYHKDSENDLLGMDIAVIKKAFEDMGQSYDNYLKIPNINISNYLTERKQKCEQVAHLLDSLENDFVSGVEYIAQKTIAQEEYEEEQRQLAEQRRIEKQQMWAAFGAALAGAVVSTTNAISSNKSSGSSISSTGITRNYNSSSSTSSSYSSSSSSTSTETREKEKVMKKCNRCNGTGRLPNVSIHNADGPKSYCSECGTDSPKHTHLSCSTCKGTGEVFDKWK